MEEKKEEHRAKHQNSKINLYYIFIGIALLLGAILLINIVLTFNLNKEMKKASETAQERLKPAKIELTLIKNSKCSDCFDISTVVSHIKNANVDVTKESMFEFDSKEGKEIIGKHKIEKVPTVVVTGEVDKVNIQGLEKKENALLLTRLEPPYANAATGEIKGRVTLYYLNYSKCEKCADLTILINQIKGAGVKISEEKVIAPNSDEGKELTKKYGIDFAPTIILSEEASVYEIMQQAWSQIGSKENDGAYVFRGGISYPNLPYMNLTTSKLTGLVNIIYLTDKSCEECYNVTQHRLILTQNFAVKLEKEETIDISDDDGKMLTAKYNITQVPTVILSSEINAYPSTQILKQFFSAEKDGSFVFRRLLSVGTYKDLTTNKVVEAQQAQEQ